MKKHLKSCGSKSKAGDKLYNVVGATLLFPPTTYLFLCNKAEINSLLHQHVVQSDPSLGLGARLI